MFTINFTKISQPYENDQEPHTLTWGQNISVASDIYYKHYTRLRVVYIIIYYISRVRIYTECSTSKWTVN